MSFTCPTCARTSHNPNDERYRYCGACHKSFPRALEEPADIVAIRTLIAEAHMIAARGVTEGLPEQHQQHWRAVTAWLRSHLPPAYATVDDMPPCRDCLDLGVHTEDGLTWAACSCPVGQYLDDLSA